MSITQAKLRELGNEVRSVTPTSTNNCGMIHSFLSDALSDNRVTHQFVSPGQIAYDGETAPHQFVVIAAGEVEGVQGEVIVDCALDQFNQRVVANEANDIDLCLPGLSADGEPASGRPPAQDASDLPAVGIFRPSSTAASWYNY